MNELMRALPMPVRMTVPSPVPMPIPMPISRANVTIRPGVPGDVPFFDALQKLHTKQVGWMPRAQFEGKIALGHVLVAEETGVRSQESGGRPGNPCASSPDSCLPSPDSCPTPVGYLIGNDQYFKHDDVGIIYQMNVLPGKQRGLVGAALLKAQFERSAYGCRLYCCWCVQDIAANKFWEAMGFVPLAFRTGGEKKGPNGGARVHIFWQKRIRQGDTGDVTRGGTAWWFPSQTSGGSLRSDRIVLPIPPGTHWSDAKPIVLPGTPMPGDAPISGDAPVLMIEGDAATSAVPLTTGTIGTAETPTARASRRPAKAPAKPTPLLTREPVTVNSLKTRGLRFGPVGTRATPTESVAHPTPPGTLPATPPVVASKPAAGAPRKATKNDPRLVAAARELRDRWLDQINATPLIGCEKYAVSRAIARGGVIGPVTTKLLAA